MQKDVKRAKAPKPEGSDKAKVTDNLISMKQFQAMDLRVANVLSAEPISGANRLLKLEVVLGDEKRQVVAGIAEHYTPEELVGKQVILVANLEPATIRGVESQGMVLAAADAKALVLVTLEKEIPSGTQVQ